MYKTSCNYNPSLAAEKLCSFNPQDPVIYDFALFGIGIGGKLKS
ncbi:MAG: DUF2400 domain-containing protein [Tannerella sp.]|nr:DUF2400 domain-containing protein [Tannerella sp.]